MHIKKIKTSITESDGDIYSYISRSISCSRVNFGPNLLFARMRWP